MKTLLKNSLTFLLMLMPVLAFAQQAPQIMNVSARQTTSLDGQWKTIVDPFENGYYDYRLKPYDGGYAQDKTYSDKTKLQEYDFETDKLLFVPGDWNTQRPQLYYYEGTVWYRKHFEYSLQPGKRLFLNFGAVNYEAIVWLNGKRLGRHIGGFTPFNFEITNLLKEEPRGQGGQQTPARSCAHGQCRLVELRWNNPSRHSDRNACNLYTRLLRTVGKG